MHKIALLSCAALAVALSIAPAGAEVAVSGVNIERDGSIHFEQDPRGESNFNFGVIPNQAIAFAGVQIPTFPSPIFLADGACAVTVPGCFAPSPARPLPSHDNFVHEIDGVTLIFNASAGNDLVSTSVQAISDEPGPVAVFNPVLASASEWQKVSFNVAGDGPDLIPVDVRFSVAATMSDVTGALQGQGILQTYAMGSMTLIDSASIVPDLEAGEGFVADVLLRAGAFAGFAGTGGIEEVLGIDLVETVMVAPNIEYWINLNALAQFSTTVFAPDEPITGPLDVTLSAWADPTFELNAIFAAENPDIAAAFAVARAVVVPIPAALPLLSSALLGLALLARRRRTLTR